MSRSDLLQLDDDALVVLANRGLLKRARRDLERGRGPVVTVREDGVVEAVFGDGVRTLLPPDVALRDASCSCAAARVCRHRIGAVLGYQALVGATGPQAEVAACTVDDDALQRRLGSGAWRQAERARRQGYSATLQWSVPPAVRLPTCTVRFLVPWDLAHVQCDCRSGGDCAHVAMAVWALRQRSPSPVEDTVSVGGGPGEHSEAAVLELQAWVRQLVARGWTGEVAALLAPVAALRRRLERARRVWLADLLSELAEAFHAVDQARSTADVDHIQRLIAELALRSGSRPCDDWPRGHLHGDRPAGATPLDHLVLRALGARYRVRGAVGTVSIFLRADGHPDTLVLERKYTVEPGRSAPRGPVIAERRLARSTVRTLAAGTLTTRAAKRRPNRLVEVGGGRRLDTALVPSTGRRLEASARADYAELQRIFASRPPDALAPRLRASRVAVVRMGEVRQVAYDPGAQVVWGVLADEEGHPLLVSAAWRPEAPGAPAALAAALLDPGSTRFMTAELRLRAGRLHAEPILLATGEDQLTVVDFVDDAPIPPLPVMALPDPDGPLERAVSRSQSWLAETARRGVELLTHNQLATGRSLARTLREVGLLELASAVAQVAGESSERAPGWQRAAARCLLLEHALARVEAVPSGPSARGLGPD